MELFSVVLVISNKLKVIRYNLEVITTATTFLFLFLQLSLAYVRLIRNIHPSCFFN